MTRALAFTLATAIVLFWAITAACLHHQGYTDALSAAGWITAGVAVLCGAAVVVVALNARGSAR